MRRLAGIIVRSENRRSDNRRNAVAPTLRNPGIPDSPDSPPLSRYRRQIDPRRSPEPALAAPKYTNLSQCIRVAVIKQNDRPAT